MLQSPAREASAGSLARVDRVRPAARPAVLVVGLGGLILALALASRLFGLDRYSGSYPEGIRAEQLLLMAHGFRPFKEIFSDQGPWLLQALYPGYALLGGSLIGVRITVVAASLVGLLGVGLLAWQVAGRWAALSALLLLTLSPLYLQFSRLAVAEVLALAPACLALGCAIQRARGGGERWVLLAGLLLATSLLLKPITLGTAPALALALLLGPRRFADLLLLAVACGLVLVFGVALVGWEEVSQQIVGFRAASRVVEGWSLGDNLKRLRTELAPEGLPLLALAGLGALMALRHRLAWPLLLWALAGGATILAHAPLHSKHFVIVVAPLVVLAAIAMGQMATWLVRRAGRVGSAWARLLAVVLLLLVPLVAALAVARADLAVLTEQDLAERDGARQWYADASESLRRVVGPDEYLVTDHAYLAWAADRLMPPDLVEASATRVRAGSLTDASAIEATRRTGARAVLLWAAEGDSRPVLWLRDDQRMSRTS